MSAFIFGRSKRRIGVMAALSVGFALNCFHVFAETGVATLSSKSSDPIGQSSLTNAANWSVTTRPADWEGGAPLPVDEAASTWKYVIGSRNVRTFNATDTTILAKAVTVNGSELAIANNGKNMAVASFGNDGLFLQQGRIGNYYGTATYIDGSVTVTAAASAPFTIYASQRCNAAGTDHASLYFRGNLTGTETAGLILARNSGTNYTFGNATNTVFAFSGDMDGYYGTITVAVYPNDTSAMAYEQNRRTTLRRVTSTTLNGSLALTLNTGLDLWGSDVAFTVKNLSFGRNNVIRYKMNPADGAAILKVTDQLTFTEDEPVTIEVDVSGSAPTSSQRYPLLTAPEGVTLSEDVFLFRASGQGLAFEIGTDSEGRSTLYAVCSPQITLTTSDLSKGNESYSQGRGKAGDANNWSDVKWPCAGYAYLVEGKVLRAPENGIDGADPGLFRGDSLMLRNGASLDHCARNLSIDRFYAEALTRNVTVKYVRAGVCTLAGNWQVTTGSGTWFVYQLSQNRTMTHNEELSGSGQVRFAAYYENADATPQGTHTFSKTNPSFSGNLHFCYVGSNSTWTNPDTGEAVTVPNMDHCCRVRFTDAGAFGRSTSATTNRLAVMIEDYSVIEPLNDVTFDDPFRGWSIKNYTGDTGCGVARFDVPENVTMTFKQPLDFNADYATLIKEGDGCLALGDFTPTFWGANPNPTANVSNNMVRVTGGSVKILTGKVFEGLQVFFGPDTKLVLDATSADPTLQRYGVWNNVYRRGRTDRTGGNVYGGKPLSLIGGAETLNVEIAAEAGAEAPDVMPLVTVGAEYAEEVAGFLAVTHPYTGVWAKVTCSDPFDAPSYGGQLVTIRAAFIRGMSLIIR